MRNYLLIVVYLVSSYRSVQGAHEITAIPGLPWPQPQQVLSLPTFFTIDQSKFTFLTKGAPCDLLTKAIQRYERLTFPVCLSTTADRWSENEIQDQLDPMYLGSITNLTIQIRDCPQLPQIHMDEMYTLRVNSPDFPDQAFLFANSIWGALRGLETFSQLVHRPPSTTSTSTLTPSSGWRINSTFIMDFPRFTHRGLMLDTSRHFLPLPRLLQNLDAMAWNKMNVFHWHIVDDPSFPYVSPVYPKLSEKGAFRASHTYSPADVSKVIEYARERGIRVMPEFDSPGHTQSWGRGQPELLTPCYGKGDKGSKPDGTFGPIDPSSNGTYPFLSALFREVASVFPDNYTHLGGDEVSFDCWRSNPGVNAYMAKLGIPAGDYSKLESAYMQRVVDIVRALGESYVVWQEVFDNGVKLAEEAVVHVWRPGYQAEMSKVTGAGFKSLLSAPWYLNLIQYGSDWESYYLVDPQDFNGTEAQRALVLGGEACNWGEYVDGQNVISRTWPRASAIAERLWSPSHVRDLAFARLRIEGQRCRMIARGLQAEPINGPGFCPCDVHP